jgi:hypothetical protein
VYALEKLCLALDGRADERRTYALAVVARQLLLSTLSKDQRASYVESLKGAARGASSSKSKAESRVQNLLHLTAKQSQVFSDVLETECSPDATELSRFLLSEGGIDEAKLQAVREFSDARSRVLTRKLMREIVTARLERLSAAVGELSNPQRKEWDSILIRFENELERLSREETEATVSYPTIAPSGGPQKL